MNIIYRKFIVAAIMTMTYQFVAAQVSPPVVTGIYNLSGGNEIRLYQADSKFPVSGNLINPKHKVIAQFEGDYNPSTGRLEGVLIRCAGMEEELLWYFTRNTADRAEVYLGNAGKETKAVASRVQGNPLLEFPCKTSRRKVKKIIRKDNERKKKAEN